VEIDQGEGENSWAGEAGDILVAAAQGSRVWVQWEDQAVLQHPLRVENLRWARLASVRPLYPHPRPLYCHQIHQSHLNLQNCPHLRRLPSPSHPHQALKIATQQNWIKERTRRRKSRKSFTFITRRVLHAKNWVVIWLLWGSLLLRPASGTTRNTKAKRDEPKIILISSRRKSAYAEPSGSKP